MGQAKCFLNSKTWIIPIYKFKITIMEVCGASLYARCLFMFLHIILDYRSIFRSTHQKNGSVADI